VTATKVAARRLVLRTRPSVLSVVIGLIVGLVAWELVAQVFATTTPQGDRVMPSLLTVATTGFLGVSDYWTGGFGVEATSAGGAQSVEGAVLALTVNAAITFFRVLVGLSLAIIVGIGLGLLLSAVRPVRLSAGGVAEMFRMLPGLAMAPLFTLWFGATDLSAIMFVVFGVAFILIVGTTNAVTNLPPHIMEYPRTLGVWGLNMWLRVVVPAILPELRGTLVFGGLIAWTSVLAGEIYGLTSGLGWMLNETLRFSLVDRMVVVALIFSALALATMKALGALTSRLTRWA
jgi:sulfonate transport system permease protein